MVPGVATGLVWVLESVSLGESARVPVSQAIWVESSAPGSLVWSSCGVGVAGRVGKGAGVPGDLGGELGPGVARVGGVVGVGVTGPVGETVVVPGDLVESSAPVALVSVELWSRCRCGQPTGPR